MNKTTKLTDDNVNASDGRRQNFFRRGMSAVSGFFHKLGTGKSVALAAGSLALVAVIVCGIIFWPAIEENVFGIAPESSDSSGTKKVTVIKKIIKKKKPAASSSEEGSSSTSSDSTSGGTFENLSSDGNYSGISGGSADTSSELKDTNATIFRVSDYGATGDGVTDDAEAIDRAIEAAHADSSAKKIVQFESNKTYRIASVPKSNQTYSALFQLFNSENIIILGNSTTLLLKAPVRVAYLQECKNITISGFIVDYDPKPFAVGTVKSVDESESTITFKCSYDLGVKEGETVVPNTTDYFAFRNLSNERRHFFIDEITNNGSGTYTFHFTSKALFNYASVGTEFILPVYGASHNGSQLVSVNLTDTCTVKNLTINSVPAFVFGLRQNSGKINFYNIRLAPSADSKVKLVSWRDGFHIKDNTAQMVWNMCYIGPLGDDAFNLASDTWRVDAYNSQTKAVTAYATEGGTSRSNVSVGDEVVFYDQANGKAIGTATITKILMNNEAVSFMIDRDLSGIKSNVLAACYAYNKNFVVKNSYIEGTVRVRSTGTFQNCKFNVFWVRVENDNNAIEGPIPKDVTFANCTFSTPYAAGTNVFFVATNTTVGNPGEYKCKNIVLSGCRFIKCGYEAQSGNELIIK